MLCYLYYLCTGLFLCVYLYCERNINRKFTTYDSNDLTAAIEKMTKMSAAVVELPFNVSIYLSLVAACKCRGCIRLCMCVRMSKSECAV